MPRSVLPGMTAVLAALTMVGLLAAFVAVRPPAPVASVATQAANRAMVRRFYDAVNAGIATGDPAPLAALLAPDFFENDVSGLDTVGRDALERYVLSLHETVPGARLMPEAVVAEGDRVIALVRVAGADRGAALGLTLEEPTIWPPVDAFRLTDARIVERFGGGERRVLVERQARIPLLRPVLEVQIVTAFQIALPPATGHRAAAVAGPRVLVVESGAAVIDTVPPGEESDLDEALERGPWEFVIVPTGTGYAVDNPGSEPAALIEVRFTAPASPWSAYEAAPPIATDEGVPARTLAGGVPVTVPTAASTLAIGQATLAPGAALVWERTAGPVVLVVEAGVLTFEATGGPARNPAVVRRGEDGQTSLVGAATLAAGDGALIDAATAAEVRNVGDAPLVVRLLTITPAVSEAAPVDDAAAIRRIVGTGRGSG